MRQQRRRQQRRAKLIFWSTFGTTVALLGLIGFAYLRIQNLLYIQTTFPAINGVSCDSMEQSGFHIHAHVTIYISGKRVTVPAGIGIETGGPCFYWLHTHTSDGVIHIEAPQKQSNLALDDFLTVWHLGFANLNFPPELNLSTGWKIFVNGQPFTAPVTSPLTTEVPLSSHTLVTLEYGTPNPKPDDLTSFVFAPNLTP